MMREQEADNEGELAYTKRSHLVVLIGPPGSGKAYVRDKYLGDILNRLYAGRKDIQGFALENCEFTTRDDVVQNDQTFIQQSWQTWTQEGRREGQTWQQEARALGEDLGISFSDCSFDLVNLQPAQKTKVLEFFDALNRHFNDQSLYLYTLRRTEAHSKVDHAIRSAVRKGRHAIIDLAGRWGERVWSEKLNDAFAGASPEKAPVVTVLYPIVTSVERLQEAVIRRMMADANSPGNAGLRLCFNLGVTSGAESLLELKDNIQGNLECFLNNQSKVISNVILFGNDWRDGVPKHRNILCYLRVDETLSRWIQQPVDPDSPNRLLLQSWLDEVGGKLHAGFCEFLQRKANGMSVNRSC